MLVIVAKSLPSTMWKDSSTSYLNLKGDRLFLVVPVNLCDNYDFVEAHLVLQRYDFSFVDILVPICLEKPLDLMVLLELLEVNDLAWTEVLVGPLSWQRGCLLKEKRNLISWQITCYIAACARVTQHMSG